MLAFRAVVAVPSLPNAVVICVTRSGGAPVRYDDHAVFMVVSLLETLDHPPVAASSNAPMAPSKMVVTAAGTGPAAASVGTARASASTSVPDPVKNSP